MPWHLHASHTDGTVTGRVVGMWPRGEDLSSEWVAPGGVLRRVDDSTQDQSQSDPDTLGCLDPQIQPSPCLLTQCDFKRVICAFKKKIFIEVYLIYNPALFQVYNKVILLDINIYSLFFRFSSHIGYHRLLRTVPCFLSHSVVSDSVTSWTVCSPPGSSVHGDSPGKNTRVGCHALLQGIFPTQGSNPGLLHCRRILYHLSR